jgi:protein tyrosine phosphatase
MIYRLTKKRNVNKSQNNVKSSNAKHQLTKKHINRKSQNRKTKLYKVRKGVQGFKEVKGKKTVQKGGLVCKPPKKGFFKTIFGKKNDPKKQMEECFKTQLLNMIKARDTSKSGFIYLHPYDDLICRLYFDVEINTNPYTYLSPKIVFDEYKYITNFLDILPDKIKTISRTYKHLNSNTEIRYNFYDWLINYYDFIFKDENYKNNKLILEKFRKIKFTDESQKTYTHTNNLNSDEFIKHREVVDNFIQKISSDYVEPTSQALSSPTSPAPPINRNLKPNTNHKDIKHIWFTNWPDHGVPKDMTLFHAFITYVYEDMKKGGNTVIHCSAGIGRTGVVYIVLKIKNKIEKESIKKKDINEELIQTEIQNARKHREGLVQSSEQYQFICNYFDIINVTKNFGRFKGFITKQPGKCGMDNTVTGTNPEHKVKNRYGNIIPCEDHRVKSMPEEKYINASTMEPLNINGNEIKIIAAQCPLPNTIPAFYEMLEYKNIKRIIMVTGLVEDEKIKCEDYFGSTLNIGGEIQEITPPKYIVDKLILKNTQNYPNIWGEIRVISNLATPNTDIVL